MHKVFILLFGSLVLLSCGRVLGKRVNGSGPSSTSNRSISGFNEIDARSNIDVYVKTDSSYSVRVVTDDNIQEFIQTEISGSTLEIGIKRGYRPKPTDGIKVYVTAPAFKKLEASGVCNYISENQLKNSEGMSIKLSGASDANLDLNAPDVSAELSGAGTLTLKGQARSLSLKGTGSTKLYCGDMMAENVKVTITGAGKADVFASVKLDVKVTGSGSVNYKGNPSISQRVSGSGSVQKID